MTAKSDPLSTALKRLEQSAAAKAEGRDWTSDVEQALAATEQALRQRKQPLRPPDGKLVDVERPRLPSATVDRRAAHLRKDVDVLLRDAEELRSRAATGDPAAIRQRVQELAEGLQQFIDHEAKLVLQSVNTDIGGND